MAMDQRKFQIVSRAAMIRLAIAGLVLVVPSFIAWTVMIRMPRKSYSGPLPPLTSQELELSKTLRRDVEQLAGGIEERNVEQYLALVAAANFVQSSLQSAGYFVQRQGYTVGTRTCHNLEVEIAGVNRPEEIVVIGAHYDSVTGAPGANDNASGVGAMLALARSFAGKKPARTLRFVAFVNEEPPYFQTESMGSLVYARRSSERGENVVAMISLETVGYFSDAKGSQSYPKPFSLLYPSTGNFIAFIGDVSSRQLVRDAIGSFRRHAKFPSEGAAVPGGIDGVGWSDHWAFWQVGYPAIMVTDTAPFRYSHYHTDKDTPDKIDYDHMARVVMGLENVVEELVK